MPDSKAQANPSPPKPFWPHEFLTEDIPEAQVWTYGYNADVIEGLFRANTKNSVSQHGRDLAAKLEREIDNAVGINHDKTVRARLTSIVSARVHSA